MARRATLTHEALLAIGLGPDKLAKLVVGDASRMQPSRGLWRTRLGSMPSPRVVKRRLVPRTWGSNGNRDRHGARTRHGGFWRVPADQGRMPRLSHCRDDSSSGVAMRLT